MKRKLHTRKIFQRILILGAVLFSFPLNLQASPLVFSQIQEYVDDYGVAKLEDAYHKLKVASSSHENYYVRSQVHQLLGRIEDEYAISLATFENKNVIRGKNKRFVMSDGTLFSEEKSEIEKPLNKRSSVEFMKNDITEKNPIEEQIVVKEQVELQPKSQSKSQRPPNVYTMNNATIDITQVQLARQGRVNDLRRDRGLYPMTFDTILHKTGADRATTIRKKQSADHRRFSNSAYYDYGQLVQRFADRGVTFKNVSRATFTENIGRAGFYCDQGDCTQEAITSLKRTFDYFRNEEGTAYDVHWRTMIHPLFRVMGIGISVDEPDNKIYIAIHYGTEVE